MRRQEQEGVRRQQTHGQRTRERRVVSWQVPGGSEPARIASPGGGCPRARLVGEGGGPLRKTAAHTTGR